MAGRSIAVVGAGITGLAAAVELARLDPDADLQVFEASDRVGGKILTTGFAGRPVDCGADAFLARVPEGIELCRRLGLADHLVSPASRHAYVYSRGALRPFPAGARCSACPPISTCWRRLASSRRRGSSGRRPT